MTRALVRGGIAPRRARRLVSEFEAHRDDLVRERLASSGGDLSAVLRQADAQLGDPQVFVERVLSQPGLKSIAWRCPWFAYALLPVVALAAGLVVSVCGLMGIGWLIKTVSGPLSNDSTAARWLAGVAPLYLCWLAPALGGSLLARSAIARGARAFWPWLGVLAMALLGASTNFGIDLPPQVPEAQFAGGIGLQLLPSPETCARLLVTCLCAWAVWQHGRRSEADLTG